MGDELIEDAGDETRGMSRRNALRAGAAVGVGAVAWSGMTITSLGGTPAYAASCTFVDEFNLTEGCRNTDEDSNCTGPAAIHFRYHQTLKQNPATGFTVVNQDTLDDPGICCDEATTTNAPIFKWTVPNLQCQVFVQFWTKNCGAGGTPGPYIFQQFGFPDSGPTTDGTTGISILLPCPTINNPGGTDQNAQYSILAFCSTVGADPDCLTPPTVTTTAG